MSNERRKGVAAPGYSFAYGAEGFVSAITASAIRLREEMRHRQLSLPQGSPLPLVGDKVLLHCDSYGYVVGWIMVEPVTVHEQVQEQYAGYREGLRERTAQRCFALDCAVRSQIEPITGAVIERTLALAERFEAWLAR